MNVPAVQSCQIIGFVMQSLSNLRVASCDLRVANYTFKACKLQYIHLRYLASKQKWKTKCLMLNNLGSYGKGSMQGER